MSPLVETVSFVFGLVAFGYVAGWSGLLKPQTGDALSEFAVTVAVPLLLFRTMAGAAFDGNLPWALWTTYFSAVAVAWVAGHFTIVHFFGRDARAGNPDDPRARRPPGRSAARAIQRGRRGGA